MTITELEVFYRRLDAMQMSPAERTMAKARLEQAENFAAAVHGVVTALKKLLPGQSGKQLGSVGA